MNPVCDEMNTTMNYTTTGEHQPHAERNNRYLKERIRTKFQRMPFKEVPKIITRRVCQHTTERTNWYPPKGGISSHFSPHKILEQRDINWEHECAAEIGSFVHAWGHDTNNSQKCRVIEGIYLGPTKGLQEGHEILNLQTGKPVTRRKIQEFPMTRQVINIVEDMAADEGVRHFHTYTKNPEGQLIIDADLLAEVGEDIFDEDYTEENTENRSDNILRNENISEEEVEELLADAEEHEETSDSEDSDVDSEESDDESYASEESEESDSDIESDQNQQEDQHEEDMTDEQDEAMNELFNKDKKDDNPEQATEFLQEVAEDTKDEEDIDDIDDETTDPSPRKLRSGQSYVQDGIKMRPSLREGKSRLRYDQPYLKKKKSKPNSKKNRSAMRAKTKKKELKSCIKKKLGAKKEERKKVQFSMLNYSDEYEMKEKEKLYNICHQQNGTKQDSIFSDKEYPDENALMMARVMQQIKDKVETDGVSFIQQYYITKGLKLFKEDGEEAAIKELEMMLRRNCFSPVHVEDMSESEKRKAADAMLLLAQKNDDSIKGRMVFKGSQTRDWISREEASSPTASHEALCSTCVIDAHEGRDMMSLDIPNAFIQTPMEQPKEGEDRVTMKITGVLVKYLTELDPRYRDYVVYENGKRVIYVVVLRAIYGMLVAGLLFYKKLKKDLEGINFKFNPYDPCVANREVNGKQHTIRFHVDDILSSHIDPKVNDDFHKWAQSNYGAYKDVKCTRGKVHTFLGMTLDFRTKGKFKIRMDDYMQRMLEEFPKEFKEEDIADTPAKSNLFEVGKGAPLDPERQQIFHQFVAKNLFLAKRARVDLGTTVAILTSRVQKPNLSDWGKLVRLMLYIKSTPKWHLTLSADDLTTIKWFIDASFAVHPDFKSHTGATMTMGEGAVQTMSRKQKLNSRSSTEAELIAVDDAITQVLWTRLFMAEQGYPVKENIVYQDNKSAILLEKNGRASCGKRTRAINIRYFFVTDQVEKGHIKIDHCPTDDLWGDFQTKALQGEKFRKFRALLQGSQN